MTKQLYKTIKGLTDASLRTPDGRLLILPTAAGSVFNPGQEVQVIEGNSKLGEMVIVDTYTMSRKPEVKLDWKEKNIALIGMRLGLEMQQASNVLAKVISNGFHVTKISYAGNTAGYEGFGMAADQAASLAYMLDENDSPAALTRQPFATFDEDTPLSFAQGANGALKFSTDLVDKYVAYELPHELASAMKLTENDFSAFELTMMTIMTDRSILQWNFPSVSVKLEEGEIDMSQPEMSVTFRVQDDGSDCLPYNVIYKGKAQRRRCA